VSVCGSVGMWVCRCVSVCGCESESVIVRVCKSTKVCVNGRLRFCMWERDKRTEREIERECVCVRACVCVVHMCVHAHVRILTSARVCVRVFVRV